MKKTTKNICQSCGMPLRKILDFGTYKDGSINTEYCHYCYQEGSFTDKDASLEAKIAKNIKLAYKLGMSRAKASKLANTVLPQLKRWRKRSETRKQDKHFKEK